jgi:hypothetical protein
VLCVRLLLVSLTGSAASEPGSLLQAVLVVLAVANQLSSHVVLSVLPARQRLSEATVLLVLPTLAAANLQYC